MTKKQLLRQIIKAFQYPENYIFSSLLVSLKNMEMNVITIENVKGVRWSFKKFKYHNVILKYGFFSKAGQDKNNILKINQDAYLSWINFLWNDSSKTFDSVPKKIHLFGVFDGHGNEGRTVSNFVKTKLPNYIKRYIWKGDYSIPEILSKSIKKVDSELKKSKIESHYSGTTCCLALIRDNVFHRINIHLVRRQQNYSGTLYSKYWRFQSNFMKVHSIFSKSMNGRFS